MKKWNPIVCNSLIPSIQDFMGGELSEKRLEELKNLWLNRLFQHGKVNVILDKFKVSCFLIACLYTIKL
jgi:hypothetical protein